MSSGKQMGVVHDVDVARMYHLHSSNVRGRTIEGVSEGDDQPERLRTVVGAPRTSLPGRDFRLGADLGEVLERRRSVRDFSGAPLPLATLGRLLHTSFGVGARRRVEGLGGWERPVPSAGGLYPLEIHLVTRAVIDLADGAHHYDARAHALELTRLGQSSEALIDLTMGQEMVELANAVCVITAVRQRTMFKYGQRGYRYLYLDAGHLGQNLYLVATALGLGAVGIGGFLDAELGALLGLPEDEDPLYVIAVGQPARRAEEGVS